MLKGTMGVQPVAVRFLSMMRLRVAHSEGESMPRPLVVVLKGWAPRVVDWQRLRRMVQ